jgi:hypothetical protein
MESCGVFAGVGAELIGAVMVVCRAGQPPNILLQQTGFANEGFLISAPLPA